MPGPAAELAHRLAREAEAVCRHYLSHGRREGSYWRAGCIANTPGRSLYVRLRGPCSGPGAAGKWTDAATGEHGDLLDLIALSQGLHAFPDVLDEARRFLVLPRPAADGPSRRTPRAPAGSAEAARRLFAAGQPLLGTLAWRYLRSRGLVPASLDLPALRYHPRCYHRASDSDDVPGEAWPALLAAVSDLSGRITGVHRTWLDPSGRGKARLASPRRALGCLLGHGVRFGPVPGAPVGVMAAGEGVETVLSLRGSLPCLPLVAALSAAHLAALVLPPGLRRLYVAVDRDAAGRGAAEQLRARAEAAGIEVCALRPCGEDFNEDLRALGAARLRSSLAAQLLPEDRTRHLA